MSNDVPAVGMKEAVEILESGSSRSLSDVYNIEAILELIRTANQKKLEFSLLKKKRNQVIDQEIENLDSRVEFLRSIIAKTLKEHKQKSISFPGVAKVSQRKKKGGWLIKDEGKLLEALKQEQEYDAIVESKPSIRKGELNKLLDVWESIQKIPPCVEREHIADEIDVTISFEKIADDNDVVPVPIKPSAPAAISNVDLNVHDFASGGV